MSTMNFILTNIKPSEVNFLSFTKLRFQQNTKYNIQTKDWWCVYWPQTTSDLVCLQNVAS